MDKIYYLVHYKSIYKILCFLLLYCNKKKEHRLRDFPLYLFLFRSAVRFQFFKHRLSLINLLHFFFDSAMDWLLFNSKKNYFTHRILASSRASSTMEPDRQTHPWQRSALPAADPTIILCTQSPFVAHKLVHTFSPVPSAIRGDVRDLSMVDNRTAGRRMVPAEAAAICDFYEGRCRWEVRAIRSG